MTDRELHRLAVPLVVIGAALMAAAVLAAAGGIAFLVGAVVLAAGIAGWVVARSRWGRLVTVSLAATLAVAVVAGSMVALLGLPGSHGSWEEDVRLSSSATRLGDVVVDEGVAYDAASGAVAWRLPQDGTTFAVTEEAVVSVDEDGGGSRLVARTPTSGNRIWSVPDKGQ